jgi:dihydrodipicolinate synthase/N-acetylneuraminate lyase
MIRGILPPLTTPFREDGALDVAAFEANLAIYATQDLGGVLVLGSNGEAQVLDEAEKLTLVRATRARVPDRTVLVGTGLESTRATIALTRKVADLGADAVLVLTPHYYKSQMTGEALRVHFEAVADASSIPVLLYSVPAFTGITWPAGLAAELARHPLIRGMKESSGDVGLLGRLVASVPPRFGVICGSAPVIYPALCVGAVGGILAAACCAPRPVTALYQAFREGDHARARRLQEAVAPLAVAITATHGVAGLKAAMDLAGFRGGPVRAPLRPVKDEVRADLRILLDRAERAV